MKKLSLLFTLLVLVAIVAMAAAPAYATLARLTVTNNTGETVYIKLTYNFKKDANHDETPQDSRHYYFTIKDGKTMVYTVDRHDYSAQVWACGKTKTAKIDILTNLFLNFPSCTYAANAGEPSMEKIHLKDTPAQYDWVNDQYYKLQEWRFRYSGYASNPWLGYVCYAKYMNWTNHRYELLCW
jgi:hypothetical protein